MNPIEKLQQIVHNRVEQHRLAHEADAAEFRERVRPLQEYATRVAGEIEAVVRERGPVLAKLATVLNAALKVTPSNHVGYMLTVDGRRLAADISQLSATMQGQARQVREAADAVTALVDGAADAKTRDKVLSRAGYSLRGAHAAPVSLARRADILAAAVDTFADRLAKLGPAEPPPATPVIERPKRPAPAPPQTYTAGDAYNDLPALRRR